MPASVQLEWCFGDEKRVQEKLDFSPPPKIFTIKDWQFAFNYEYVGGVKSNDIREAIQLYIYKFVQFDWFTFKPTQLHNDDKCSDRSGGSVTYRHCRI